MSRAFVFLNCDIGTEEGIVTEVRGISGVSQASNVSGIYDIVAELSSESNSGIAIIVKQLRLISSVRSCLTMMVAERTATKASEISL
jgi:AsnC-like helix-turn-helix protein